MKTDIENIMAMKIPALRGRKAKTNSIVLELLALEGPQTVWNINKMLGRRRELYPTILKAIARLKNRGYVAKTGTVKMAKKKGRTSTFGLTWRGFIVSLTSDKVCSNILTVLEKNPQLQFPLPREITLAIAEILGNERLKKIAKSLQPCFLEAIPNDVELIKEEEYPLYLFPALAKAEKLKEIKIEQKELIQIFDKIRRYPNVIDWFEKGIEGHIKTLKEVLEGAKKAREFIQILKSQPSEALKLLEASLLKG